LLYLSVRGARLGVIVTTGAAAVWTAVVVAAGSVFIATIDIESAAPC
jgi:hypothetical protein